jgi:hypothetical protein
VQKVPFLIERDVGATVFAPLQAGRKASDVDHCDHLGAAPLSPVAIASREARIDVTPRSHAVASLMA